MPLLVYVNFEEGAASPYVLGATEHSAGDDELTLSGVTINATGATVGSYGVVFSGFDANASLAVTSGDVVDVEAGRIGWWAQLGGGDDGLLCALSGSSLWLEARSSGALRLRWGGSGGTIILNTGDFSNDPPTDRTPVFIEVKWDRANNLRAIRWSTDSTEGTWREDTSSWSAPSAATAIKWGGQYGIAYIDNLFVSDDPDEDLWELRNLEDYGDYGDGGGLAIPVILRQFRARWGG